MTVTTETPEIHKLQRVEILNMWYNELANRELPQTKHYLCTTAGECCLGVLSRVLQDHFPDLVKSFGYEYKKNEHSEHIMREWFLVDPDAGEVSCTATALPEPIWRALKMRHDQHFYYEANDIHNYTFRQIAHVVQGE